MQFFPTMAVLAALAVCGCMPAPGAYGSAGGNEPGQTANARPASPKLRRLPNGHFRVKRPWKVRLNGKTYRVQKGYTSNGITAPNAVKSTLGDGVDHPETWAAMFHDWLFTQPGMNRSKADRLFYDLLIAYGVSESKARLMYTTVSAYSAQKRGN